MHTNSRNALVSKMLNFLLDLSKFLSFDDIQGIFTKFFILLFNVSADLY